jgi:hypothetical protein
MKFRSTVELGGKTATGIEIPPNVVDELGAGRKPAVTVTLGPHTYRTTVATMGGRFLVPLSAENRTAAGVAAGDDVEVDIALDAAPREVTVPPDLGKALGATGRKQFDALSFTRRKEYVRSIETAKAVETRQRRIAKAVAEVTGT